MRKLGFSRISLKKETVSFGKGLGRTIWLRSKEGSAIVHFFILRKDLLLFMKKKEERRDEISPSPQSSLNIPDSKNI